VLLLSGWQDLFLEQTLAQYQRLHERGVPVAVTIGPWNHTQLMTKGAPTVIRDSLGWLDAHLADTRRVARRPVRIHVNGHGWRDLPGWPPAMPETVLYLRPAGLLDQTAPDADAPSSEFTYNPADPTPTIGGRLLSPEGATATTLGWPARGCTHIHRWPAARSLRRRNPLLVSFLENTYNDLRPDQRGG
jgi:predicted acyl esterase